MAYLVNLTYFQRFGKFYSSSSYVSDAEYLWAIFQEVEDLRERKKLPGLIEGHSDFIVHIDVPEHPHRHPALVVCEKWRGVEVETDSHKRGVDDCIQDYFENAPFASVGGLDKRSDMTCPSYITEKHHQVDYLIGYRDQVARLFGPDWQTVPFSWQPALTLEGRKK